MNDHLTVRLSLARLSKGSRIASLSSYDGESADTALGELRLLRPREEGSRKMHRR